MQVLLYRNLLLLLFFLISLFAFIRAQVQDQSSQQQSGYCLDSPKLLYRNLNSRQRAFNTGPCAPVIIVPGFLASSLQVQVNCTLLQQKNPDIFAACGWTTCSPDTLVGAFKGIPKKEYRLWVGQMTDRFRLLQGKDEQCLGRFLSYQESQKHYEAPEGIRVTWYGNTPDTERDSKCGANAIRDLAGKVDPLKFVCALRGFGKYIDMLENMGYTSGVNYQAVPYDSRPSAKYNNASVSIVNSIRNLYRNTGKKVVLVAHSYGNIHVLKALYSLSLAQKQEMVDHFVSIGAPFLGSGITLKNVLGWDEFYLRKFPDFEIGANMFTQKSLFQNSGAIVNFLPRYDLLDFRQDDWFRSLVNYPPDFSTYPGIDFRNLLSVINQPLVQMGNTSYRGVKTDFVRIFNKFKPQERQKYMMTMSEGFQDDPQLFGLKKPDVAVSIIYSTKDPTGFRYYYDSQEPGNLPKKTQFIAGDGTVSVLSTVLPGLKWLYEQNQGDVTFVQYAGKNSSLSKVSMKDLKNQDKKEAAYMTLKSECLLDTDSRCTHACFLQDKSIIRFVYQKIKRGKRMHKGSITHKICESLVD